MNDNQLSISEIDRKIKSFNDALLQSFVPPDEKELYRQAIARLTLQKQQLTAGSKVHAEQLTTQPGSLLNSHATQLQDMESEPGDDKKKSLPDLLALWKDLPFVERVQNMFSLIRKVLRLRFRS